MSKSIKLKNNTYWDSSSIVHGTTKLNVKLDATDTAIINAQNTANSGLEKANASMRRKFMGVVTPNTTTTIDIPYNMGLIFLFNEWGNYGLYSYNYKYAGGTYMVVDTLRECSLVTVSKVDNSRKVNFTAGQIQCSVYVMYWE